MPIAKNIMRRVKVFLILGLAALAIYQTGQLWFVNLANRNFFFPLPARALGVDAAGYRAFVRPKRLIFGDGQGLFNIHYSGLTDEMPMGYFESVLTQLFNNGNVVESGYTDYVRILSRPVIIFEYAFPMPARIFPIGFGQRNGAFLTSVRVDTFNSVAIWPPYGDDYGIRVFFISPEQTWEFALDTGATMRLASPIVTMSTDRPHYVSAALEGYIDLPPHVFIARTGDAVLEYAFNPVTVTNPYFTHMGGPGLNFVRHQVTQFFDNPATITSRVASDGVWTFSNIHTAVRYFDTAVLEYVSFRSRRQNVTSGLIGDFIAALEFIENDAHVINELYLAGFDDSEPANVFWFGYIIGDYPLLMPAGWEVSSPDDILPAPIEIIVDQGRVVRYRRLAFNFSVDYGVYEWISLDIENLQSYGDGPIENLSLGYYLRPNGRLGLEWWAFESQVFEAGQNMEDE